MSKHKHLKESNIYREKLLTKRNINKTFNMLEIILIVSCFNALFYHFGLDVNPAIGVFIILFVMTIIVYVVYKVKNRHRKKKK